MSSPAPVMAPNDGVVAAARAAIGYGLLDAVDAVGEITLTVARDGLVNALTVLRDNPMLQYQQLMEIAGVDYPARSERFEVNYHLLSLTRNHRIRVKVSTDEATPVPSVVDLWPVAGWLEREVYDMYGVLFEGNPDLRRILTDYGFRGHPFRKDFPLTGYSEMRYSEEHKRVIYEPVKLAQDFRRFDFMSPWEGAEYILPGDEKAVMGEAKGAPSPATAAQIAKAPAQTPVAATPGTPKVTESVTQTGDGTAKQGDEPATKPKRKPRTTKASTREFASAPAVPPPEKADPASIKVKGKPRRKNLGDSE